jgi:hypothetical protein
MEHVYRNNSHVVQELKGEITKETLAAVMENFSRRQQMVLDSQESILNTFLCGKCQWTSANGVVCTGIDIEYVFVWKISFDVNKWYWMHWNRYEICFYMENFSRRQQMVLDTLESILNMFLHGEFQSTSANGVGCTGIDIGYAMFLLK